MNSVSSTIFSEIIPSNGALIVVFSISSFMFFKIDFTFEIWASRFAKVDSNFILISSLSAWALARLKDAKLNFDFELKPLSISCFADAYSISYNSILSTFCLSKLSLFFSFKISSLLSLSKSFFALESFSFLSSSEIVIISAFWDTLSPLANSILSMLPDVSDLTSIFLLWIVWPCNSIDWSIKLEVNTFVSTENVNSSLSLFSVSCEYEVSVSVLVSVSSSCATTLFENWPEPIHPTTAASIMKAINIDLFIKYRTCHIY